MVRKSIAVALTALTVPVFGCGGGDDDTLTREQVRTEASAACQRATNEAEGYAQSNAPPQTQAAVAEALGAEVRIGEGAVRALGELEPDEDAADGFEQFLDAQTEAVDGTADAQAAAAEGDTAKLDQANAKVLAATERAKESADAYGLDGCPASPVSVFYAGAAPAGDSVEPTSDGTWSGQVTEVGPEGESTYGVTMTIAANLAPGEIAGTIEYPEIPCGGVVRLSEQVGDQLVLGEEIQRGQSRCGSGGEITASISGTSMSWRWEDPAGSGTVVSGELGLEG